MAVKRNPLYVTRTEFRTFAESVGRRFDGLEDTMRTFGVLLERVDSNVAALAEGQIALRTELKRDISDLEKRLTERLERLEAVVRQNSEDIRKNSEDIARLCAETRTLRERFDRREGTLEEHDRRLTDLEKRARISE